jgi:hypothetical protein
MERTSVLLTSILAATAVLAVDVLYVAVIVAQGPGPNPYVPFFVSGYLALMAVLIVVALIPRPGLARLRVPLRAAAAAGLLVLGMIAAFTIGLPIVIAGLLVVFGLVKTRPAGSRWPGAAASVVSVGVLVAGFQLTEGLFS